MESNANDAIEDAVRITFGGSANILPDRTDMRERFGPAFILTTRQADVNLRLTKWGRCCVSLRTGLPRFWTGLVN